MIRKSSTCAQLSLAKANPAAAFGIWPAPGIGWVCGVAARLTAASGSRRAAGMARRRAVRRMTTSAFCFDPPVQADVDGPFDMGERHGCGCALRVNEVLCRLSYPGRLAREQDLNLQPPASKAITG